MKKLFTIDDVNCHWWRFPPDANNAAQISLIMIIIHLVILVQKLVICLTPVLCNGQDGPIVPRTDGLDFIHRGAPPNDFKIW